MTDWPAALREMEREEPELWRRLRAMDKPFTDELQAELERLAAGPEAVDPRTGGTAVPPGKVPVPGALHDPGRRVWQPGRRPAAGKGSLKPEKGKEDRHEI